MLLAMCYYNAQTGLAGHVSRIGQVRDAYRALVGRGDGKRPLRILRARWEHKTKMDLEGTKWKDMN